MKIRIPVVGARVYFYGVGYGTIIREGVALDGEQYFVVHINTWARDLVTEPIARDLFARPYELIPVE